MGEGAGEASEGGGGEEDGDAGPDRAVAGARALGQRKLLPRLRDPFFTRVLIVTLAEATPVHEAERLQADLHRAGIEPFAWVINQSLLASGTHDPVLTQRGAYEAPFIAHVMQIAAKRCALIPWQVEAPVGELALSSLATQVPNDLRRES